MQTFQPASRDRLWATIVAAAVLFVLSGMLAAPGLTDLEVTVFDAMNDLPGVLAVLLLALMPLGSGLAAVALPVVVVPFRGVRVAAVVWLASAGSWLVANAAKGLSIRGRPIDVIEDFLPTGQASGAGFPSGHTAVAVGLAVILWPLLPRKLRPLAVIVAVGVALSRLHVGVHLPLDLVGGAAVGLAVALFVRLAVSRPERPSASQP